jgi:hypothetical protein
MHQETETILRVIEIPQNRTLGWAFAHDHLIARTVECGSWVFITLKSGHHLYGYSADGDYDHHYRAEDITPEYYAGWFADCEDWLEAIKDIPALYAYYAPY